MNHPIGKAFIHIIPPNKIKVSMGCSNSKLDDGEHSRMPQLADGQLHSPQKPESKQIAATSAELPTVKELELEEQEETQPRSSCSITPAKSSEKERGEGDYCEINIVTT
jgi:hypothetical protein